MGNFHRFFAALGDTNLRDHFQKHSRRESRASYVDDTVRVVVFVICKVRKFLMKKCAPEARQPGHMHLKLSLH